MNASQSKGNIKKRKKSTLAAASSSTNLDNFEEIEEEEQASDYGSELESEEEAARRIKTEQLVQQNLVKLLSATSGTTVGANSVTISQQVVFLTSLAATDVRKFVNFVKDGAGRVGNATLEPQWVRFIDDRIREVLLSKLRAS